MPWSPIPKFPEIIQKVKNRGNIEETDITTLKIEIKRVTGVMRKQTIANIMETMAELGFIKKNTRTPNTYWLYNGEEYKFEAEKRELDRMIGGN